ncbi:MAG: hypothetical protein ABR953_02370 [Candidatus Acidiferrales bacterium]|jgi:hypothetical protein
MAPTKSAIHNMRIPMFEDICHATTQARIIMAVTNTAATLLESVERHRVFAEKAIEVTRGGLRGLVTLFGSHLWCA